MTTVIQDIPLSKLLPSEANVRRTGRETGIEELAASIAAHGLLQNLSVRPVLKENGEETGKFEVVAGGRRLAALKVLAKRKALAKAEPIACHVLADDTAEEVSLAENITQCPMHPADQYEAFAKLASEKGMAAEDIAARFGVTAMVVKQRMKLGAVAPSLMQAYRNDEMSLDQLMAFAVTDDHARQERVWSELGWNKGSDIIRRALTQGQIATGDRRARFVGVETYEAAGGLTVRDLFDDEGGGYLADADLLERLVREELMAQGESIRAEGWKWIEIVTEFDYRLASGMRRIYPQPAKLSYEEQAKLDALEVEYDALAARHDGEVSDETAADFERIETEIEGLRGREQYDADAVARGGAFVSLGYDGVARVERGFIRREDELERKSGEGIEDESSGGPDSADSESPGDADDKGDDSSSPLSDKLVAELSAYRTAGLRNELGASPDLALCAVVHALAVRIFHDGRSVPSCLNIEPESSGLANHAPGIDENPASRSVAERHEAWAKRIPQDPRESWAFVRSLDSAEQLALLAHCASLTVDVLAIKWNRDPGRDWHADALAQDLALDMTSYWSPRVASYLGRVSKASIVEAVREGVSAEAAENIASLKKQPMAEAAEQLLAGKRWLPQLLRMHGVPLADVPAEPRARAE